MAPEQTGRVNRSIDSRSDLYSLGVTFYEMLTGSLPFTASDPMELVHCHIARQPAAPSERLPSVPRAVSAITMQLLSKTVEERYQTAAGVERDLLHCLSQWESRGSIDVFTLGAQDIRDRLMIPEKLYGRDHEIDALLGNSNFRPTPKRTFGTAASIRIGCWELVERLTQRPQMAVFEVAESIADIAPIAARAFMRVGFLDVSVTNCFFNKLLNAFAAR